MDGAVGLIKVLRLVVNELEVDMEELRGAAASCETSAGAS
jgi:hypothetical protein